MSRFVALVEEEGGVFGVSFPQLPGCVAMGDTLDEAVSAATDALAEWIADELAAGRLYTPVSLGDIGARAEVREAMEGGAVTTLVPLVSELGRPVRANLSIDAGLLEAVDEAAKRRGLTRSSWLASAARMALIQGG